MALAADHARLLLVLVTYWPTLTLWLPRAMGRALTDGRKSLAISAPSAPAALPAAALQRNIAAASSAAAAKRQSCPEQPWEPTPGASPANGSGNRSRSHSGHRRLPAADASSVRDGQDRARDACRSPPLRGRTDRLGRQQSRQRDPAPTAGSNRSADPAPRQTQLAARRSTSGSSGVCAAGRPARDTAVRAAAACRLRRAST